MIRILRYWYRQCQDIGNTHLYETAVVVGVHRLGTHAGSDLDIAVLVSSEQDIAGAHYYCPLAVCWGLLDQSVDGLFVSTGPLTDAHPCFPA